MTGCCGYEPRYRRTGDSTAMTSLRQKAIFISLRYRFVANWIFLCGNSLPLRWPCRAWSHGLQDLYLPPGYMREPVYKLSRDWHVSLWKRGKMPSDHSIAERGSSLITGTFRTLRRLNTMRSRWTISTKENRTAGAEKGGVSQFRPLKKGLVCTDLLCADNSCALISVIQWLIFLLEIRWSFCNRKGSPCHA